MTFIIAEAGVNHNGSMREAEHLIVAAKRSGADAVKFQLFDHKKLKNPALEPLQLSPQQMLDLSDYAERHGIEFMCTPFDIESTYFLAEKAQVKRLKIGSGCITNFPLLYAAYCTGLPVILSTGMCGMDEVHDALVMLASNVTLLHCTSAYPCPYAAVNLKAMDALRERFNLPVGYSDHTSGITIAMAAVARGATVIEKHLTLNCRAAGPDHASSIEPDAFRCMVTAIRIIDQSLGDGKKEVQDCERGLKKLWHSFSA
jgi:N,N'-diacetyllegionaminate synthase